jgi:hypothetical protein
MVTEKSAGNSFLYLRPEFLLSMLLNWRTFRQRKQHLASLRNWFPVRWIPIFRYFMLVGNLEFTNCVTPSPS